MNEPASEEPAYVLVYGDVPEEVVPSVFGVNAWRADCPSENAEPPMARGNGIGLKSAELKNGPGHGREIGKD